MGTPTFVKFSRIKHSLPEALIRLRTQVFDPRQILLRDAGELRHSGSAFDGGLELVDDKFHPVESEAAALKKGADWVALGLVYTVPVVPCHLYFYFFDTRSDQC